MRKQMLQPTNLYDEARRRLEELRKVYELKQEEIDKGPKGIIHICSGKNNYVQYYVRESKADKSGKYLSKTKENQIRKYIQKRYDMEVLKKMKLEIESLDKLLKRVENPVATIKNVFSVYPAEAKKYIFPIDCSDEEWLQMLETDNYERKPIDENLPVFLTDRGERVRSKSELNIANALNKHGITYRYERPIKLKNGLVYHPDFTIYDKVKRKVIYWEHRGMMDGLDYVRNSVKKIRNYQRNGIFLGDNLIISEETSINPLGTDEIEAIIKKYLL